MSDQRQNKPTGSSTLYGPPLQEVTDPTLPVEPGAEPVVAPTYIPEPKGIVIDVSQNVDAAKPRLPKNPNRRTDVQLLFKVFGEQDEAKDAQPLEGLNLIIQEYDNNKPKKKASPPPIPKPKKNSIRQTLTNPAAPSADFIGSEDEDTGNMISQLPPISGPEENSGTVAYMPHEDEESFSSEGTMLNYTGPSCIDINSEAIEIKDPSCVSLDDLQIPTDESGQPLAKILRTQTSHKPRTQSSKGYHHLSSAGLYDHSSLKFVREEISEKGYPFSPVAAKKTSIDIHLAAALEIAYGSDKVAAMRTPTLIASIIRKDPRQLNALTEHFPGRLFVDPFELPFEELEPVSQHGPIVAAIASLQMVGVNFLTRFLRHHDKFHRFYAMMLIHEIVPQSSSKILIERLCDKNPDIRVLASSLLLRRRSQPNFDEQILDPLRKIISNPNETTARIRYSARFLALVLDTQAVQSAIELLESNPNAEKRISAIDLLRSVTLRRFETTEEWKQWASSKSFAGRFTRLYWLIDALNDPDIIVREEAYAQLNPTFGTHLKEYLPTHPEPVRRRIQNLLRVQFQNR